jgi:hypothetical protein
MVSLTFWINKKPCWSKDCFKLKHYDSILLLLWYVTRGRDVVISAPGFEYRTRDRLSWLRFFVLILRFQFLKGTRPLLSRSLPIHHSQLSYSSNQSHTQINAAGKGTILEVTDADTIRRSSPLPLIFKSMIPNFKHTFYKCVLYDYCLAVLLTSTVKAKNTAKTKLSHWPRSWATSIHLSYPQPISPRLILML